MPPELTHYIRGTLTLNPQTVVVLQQFGIPATVAALEECLQQADSFEALNNCCTFLMDSFRGDWDGREAYRAALDESVVGAVMHERLLYGPPWMRETLAYSMKIGLTGHKVALREAFFQFRDTDPLLVPRLVGEALWTRAVEGDELHRALLESPSYLSRWALMECYPTREHLEKLAKDSHERLRREAAYRLAHLERDETHHRFTKSENRRRRKEIEATRPLTFTDLRVTFTSPLYRSGPEAHYTIEELAAFEETLPKP